MSTVVRVVPEPLRFTERRAYVLHLDCGHHQLGNSRSMVGQQVPCASCARGMPREP